ncbi:putative transcriptional regulator [Spiroplasma sabaudiense Ar-1343]|uniref:Type III pantothenate kinase n=1 Tax=Spiroplasma sabaudiense Ar-1343 TaxID=1276257 RepID=W6AAS6_9MOLU|nr:type III pantothenate kinase [Spiroplasma sabaudiense]AHI54116.1 putative transcriptional regulator [Spiroplasma sabaudiense Ar-1343]
MGKKLVLIDVGNTTVDIRIKVTGKPGFGTVKRFFTKEPKFHNSDYLKTVLNGMENIDYVIYSSVVPDWTEIIILTLQELKILGLDAKKDFFHNESDFNNIDLKKLGTDFIVNYYGVRFSLKFDSAIVISLGTATTFFIIKNQKFIGATIAPGIETGLNGLILDTALLNAGSYNFNEQWLGENTFDAISAGTINGHFAMIDGMVQKLRNTFKVRDVIVTGGNLKYLKVQLEQEGFFVCEDLIFQGLEWLLKQKNLT